MASLMAICQSCRFMGPPEVNCSCDPAFLFFVQVIPQLPYSSALVPNQPYQSGLPAQVPRDQYTPWGQTALLNPNIATSTPSRHALLPYSQSPSPNNITTTPPNRHAPLQSAQYPVQISQQLNLNFGSGNVQPQLQLQSLCSSVDRYAQGQPIIAEHRAKDNDNFLPYPYLLNEPIQEDNAAPSAPTSPTRPTRKNIYVDVSLFGRSGKNQSAAGDSSKPKVERYFIRDRRR